MGNRIKHFKLITTHKWYVFKNCCKAGIPLRGIKHDLSKYSPIEFNESAKYFTGTRSPIDNCKDINGISYGWMHHKGRNTHHWEYWIDNFSLGGQPQLIPYKDCVEMLCDYLGAGQAYEKDKWSFSSQYRWWENKRNHVIMHPVVFNFIETTLFDGQWDLRELILLPIYTKGVYENLLKDFKRGLLK